MEYLNPTPELLQEYRSQGDFPDREKLIESLELPNGKRDATRLVRWTKGKLAIVAPWALVDVFSIDRKGL